MIYCGTLFGLGSIAFMWSYHGLFSVSASRSLRKKLHTQFFTKGSVSLFVGFSRDERVEDGLARCQLWRHDLLIQNWWLYVLQVHWKSEDLQLVEIWYRCGTVWATACFCSLRLVSLLATLRVRCRTF